MIKQISAEC